MKTIDEFAKELSHKLHANQKRNDGVTPYTVHTDYVGYNVYKYYEYGNLDVAMAVGFGHDLAEDCDITEEWLMEQGKDYPEWRVVVHNIMLLTRVSKLTSVMDYLNNIKKSQIATAVKLADLEHNLSDLKPGNLRDKYLLCRHFLIGDEVESFDGPPLIACVDNTSRDYTGVSDLK